MIQIYLLFAVLYGLYWSYNLNVFSGDLEESKGYKQLSDRYPELEFYRQMLPLILAIQIPISSLIWPYSIYRDYKNGWLKFW